LGRLLPLLLLRRTVALSRRAAIGAVKLLHTFANVRFGESAPQRRALQRMAEMGRNFGVILSVSLKRSLAAMQKTGKVGLSYVFPINLRELIQWPSFNF
jgi:hypothetical protein